MEAPSTYITSSLPDWRQRRGLTAAQLADRVNQTGVPGVDWGDPITSGRQVVGKIEAGKRRITADEVLALARALGMSIIDLLEPGTDRQAVEVTFEFDSWDQANRFEQVHDAWKRGRVYVREEA
jgi:transcriptional regulator with XRE-family HTH domain